MPVTTVNSREARTKWRDLLDAAHAGGEDIVIERYGKPVAVLIPYEDFLALQEELDDLRAARQAGEAYERWKRDRSSARPYADVRQELVDEGLLDE